MDLFPKFIIEDGALIMSKITYHHQLVTDKTKVKGGGWFRRNSETNTFTFHGESHDFGRASIEDIKSAIDNKRVFTNRHQTHDISESNNFSYEMVRKQYSYQPLTQQPINF